MQDLENCAACSPLQGFESDVVPAVRARMEASRTSIRWKIVHLTSEHPDWSLRRLGKAVVVSHNAVKFWLEVHKRTGDVKDQPRSGRNRKFTEPVVHELRGIVSRQHAPTIFSAHRVYHALQKEISARVSTRSVRRHLRAAGMRYGHAKPVLMLQPSHKARRLQWAQKHLRKRTAFGKWMFTDSKVFQLHRTSGKCGVKMWYPSYSRPTAAFVKASQGIHVYLGGTKDGGTSPIFVTGAGGQKSTYVNPKTGRAYAGVSALEYQRDVLPKLIKGAIVCSLAMLGGQRVGYSSKIMHARTLLLAHWLICKSECPAGWS